MSVGRSAIRIDAEPKTTGATDYAGDLQPADVLHAKVVFTDQPHARLLHLDTSACALAPGVVTVVTAADVPVNEYGLTMFDQPVLIAAADELGVLDPTGPQPRVRPDVSRWEADHLAVVVAETERQAEAAALLLAPVWEELAIVADIDAALAEGAPILHDEVNPNATNPGSNAYHHYVISHGDTAAAMAEAEVIVEGTYELPYQEHAFLQTEAALAYIDDGGRVTVETGGQWTHEDQEQVAHALNLSTDRVRIIYRAIGGAFGGKEDMSLQIVLALAARKLEAMGIDRPVRCQWSREESIVGHHKRHRGRVTTRWGATADGRLMAVEATGHLDAGAYNYTSNKVLGNLHLTVAGPYRVPNARIDSWAVYTNAVPGGAFRGFGGPQGCFVAESQMNKLASACGIDPVEIRRRNVVTEGSIGITGTELPPGVSLPEVIEACASAAKWTEPVGPPKPVAVFASLPPTTEGVRRGRGFACAYKNVGFSFGFPERSEARIVLRADRDEADGGEEPGLAELYLAGADVGQGAHTAFIQMAAEATGLDPERITGHFSDTGSSGDSGSASASRLSFMTGNAILGAAEEAEKRWREGATPGRGILPLRATADRGPRSRRGAHHPELRLRLRGRGRRPLGRHHHRPHRRPRCDLRGRRRPGHQPDADRGPGRGGGGPGPRLRPVGEPPGGAGSHTQPPVQRLSDPRHRRHSGAGTHRVHRGAGSPGTVRGPGHGRNAVHPLCAGGHRGAVRRHRRLVRPLPVDPGPGAGRPGYNRLTRPMNSGESLKPCITAPRPVPRLSMSTQWARPAPSGARPRTLR